MHTASRLASHRSFKLIVRFPGTGDPDVPVINVAQLQRHTHTGGSFLIHILAPSHAKTPEPRSRDQTSSTHNQHGYNYTQVVLFRARKHNLRPLSRPDAPPLTSTSNLTLTKTPRTKACATAHKRTCSEHTFSADHNHTLLNEIIKENRPQAMITTITDRRTRTAMMDTVWSFDSQPRLAGIH